jgi:hypothetical protein
MRYRRELLVLIAVVAAAALGGAVASADVDPASDVLLLQDVFLPYNPKVCSGVADSLRNEAKTSKKAGYPIKVAVIGSRADLGGAPQLFNKPTEYAKFLGNELGVYGPGVGRNYSTNLSLLIVMPKGVSLARSRSKAAAADYTLGPPPPIAGVPPALKSVSVPPNADNDALTRVAVAAVPKLAKAAGHPIPTVSTASAKCSGTGTSPALIFGAPIAVLVLAAVGFTGFQRIRGRSERPS